MAKRINSTFQAIQRFDKVYRLLYVLLLITMLILVIASIWESHKFNQPIVINLHVDEINKKDTAYLNAIMVGVKDSVINRATTKSIEIEKSITDKTNLVYGIILAGITILLSIVVVIPKVLIKQEIEDQVNSATENINAKFHDTYKNKLAVHANTIDAHHARLITYLLLYKNSNSNLTRKEILWSIGWGARSLKNYLRIFGQDNVLGEQLSMKNYGVFATDVCTYISDACNALIQINKDQVNSMPIDYLENLRLNDINLVLPNITRENIYGTSTILSTESGVNFALRTIKEIFDLYYLIYENSQEVKAFKNYLRIFRPLSDVSDVTVSLTIALINSEKIAKTSIIYNKWEPVARKIVSISNYNNETKYHNFVDDFVKACYDSLNSGNIAVGNLVLPTLFNMKFGIID